MCNLFLQFLSTNEIDWLQLLQHFPLHRLPYFHPEKDPFCFDQAHVLMTFVHSSVHLIFHYQKHHPARKERKKKKKKRQKEKKTKRKKKKKKKKKLSVILIFLFVQVKRRIQFFYHGFHASMHHMIQTRTHWATLRSWTFRRI